MKKFLLILWGFVEFIIIICVFFTITCILFTNDYGYTQFGSYTFINVDKKTTKNLKKYKENDLLIIENNNIKKDDTLYYYIPKAKYYNVNSAKVTDVLKEGTDSIYTVKVKENLESITSNRVLGNKISTYHNLGGILYFLTSKTGFIIGIIFPIIIMLIYQIYKLYISTRYDEEEYDEDEEIKKLNKRKNSKI